MVSETRFVVRLKIINEFSAEKEQLVLRYMSNIAEEEDWSNKREKSSNIYVLLLHLFDLNTPYNYNISNILYVPASKSFLYVSPRSILYKPCTKHILLQSLFPIHYPLLSASIILSRIFIPKNAMPRSPLTGLYIM